MPKRKWIFSYGLPRCPKCKTADIIRIQKDFRYECCSCKNKFNNPQFVEDTA